MTDDTGLAELLDLFIRIFRGIRWKIRSF